jgi:hypothetical protein
VLGAILDNRRRGGALIPRVTQPTGQRTADTDEARALTDEAKMDVHALWRKLVGLYEGKAWEALDYDFWGPYFGVSCHECG